MRKNILLLLLITPLYLFLNSCATLKQSPGQQPREELLAQEKWRMDLPVGANKAEEPIFPQVQETKLANGLSILVVEDHRLPILEIALVFKNGSALDPIGKAGLQNLTALMLKEGTRKLSSLALAESFANLGTEVRVGAGKDSTFISAGILSNKFAEAIKLIAAMAQNPRLNEEDFARLKEKQLHTINSDMAMPAYLAQTRFLNAAYGDQHPYGYPSAGTPLTLQDLKLSNIKQAHAHNFGPNNAALIVVGDITLKEAAKAAKRYFGAWKKIKDPVAVLAAPKKHQKMQTLLVSRPSMPQTYLILGQPVATQYDKDLATYEVFQSIIAGLPTSRLGSNLRERKGWTYGVHTSLTPLRAPGPLLVKTSIQVPYGADALKEILNEFETMKKNPVSQAELDAAKNGLLNSFASRFSTLRKIALNAGNNFTYNLPHDRDKNYYREISQVTPEKIMAVAQKALPKDNMTAVAVGELEVMEIPLATMDVGQVIIERD